MRTHCVTLPYDTFALPRKATLRAHFPSCPAGSRLVSSSGSDAALWVDLRTRKVIRRWRLPSDIYGVNYELTPAMPVSRHYIHNDIQLSAGFIKPSQIRSGFIPKLAVSSLDQ